MKECLKRIRRGDIFEIMIHYGIMKMVVMQQSVMILCTSVYSALLGPRACPPLMITS